MDGYSTNLVPVMASGRLLTSAPANQRWNSNKTMQRVPAMAAAAAFIGVGGFSSTASTSAMALLAWDSKRTGACSRVVGAAPASAATWAFTVTLVVVRDGAGWLEVLASDGLEPPEAACLTTRWFFSRFVN